MNIQIFLSRGFTFASWGPLEHSGAGYESRGWKICGNNKQRTKDKEEELAEPKNKLCFGKQEKRVKMPRSSTW